MHVVVFENASWEFLSPLTFSRPTFTLMCGTGSLLEKQLRFLQPTRLTLWVRPQLADYCRQHVVPLVHVASLTQPVRINEPLDSDPAILIDGATLCLAVPPRVGEAAVRAPGLSHEDALDESDRWKSLPKQIQVGKPVKHLWDLLGFNEEAISADLASASSGHTNAPDGPWHVLKKENVRIEDGVILGAGCVIDASKGPVVLSRGSIIGANSVLQGPCYIGRQSEITPLSLIRPGTSIGPFCKIGGEVARAIVLGYSNKAHEGYLGDSYIGEWVNLGAGTTTSNLKNTYGSIGMHLGGKEIDTGRKFLGSIIGDHTKTAIGTRFMSGSYVGYCSMIATSAHASRFTPSFSFSTDGGTQPYRVDKAFQVGRAMYARRNRIWSSDDELLMRYAADASKNFERSDSCPA